MCSPRCIFLEKVGKICEKCVQDDTLFNTNGMVDCVVLDEKCNDVKKTKIIRKELECPINLWKYEGE